MNPLLHTVETLYAHLHSSAQGLSQAEAVRRRARYGANQIEKIAGQSIVGKLLKEFTHFFALILWVAVALAFVAEWKDPGQGMALLGYAVLGVILINGVFSFWQEYRAEKALVGSGDVWQVMELNVDSVGVVTVTPMNTYTTASNTSAYSATQGSGKPAITGGNW